MIHSEVEPLRLAEVHGGALGTGYLIAPTLVLTARHLMVDCHQIAVRFLDSEDRHPGLLAWASDELDTALVELATPVRPDLGPVRWGRLIGTSASIPCQLAGFPRAQELGDGRRGLEPLHGSLDPLAGAPHGLQVQLNEPGPTEPSPWAGLSGAAVICHGLLTALVTHSLPAYGHRRLKATAAERLIADSGFRRVLVDAGDPDGDVSNLAEAVLEPVELAPFVSAPALAPMTPDGQVSLASLLRADAETIPFLGRGDELQQLTEWCDGSGAALRLLTGPGGQGKTRLARQLTRQMRDRGWATGDLAPQTSLASLEERLAGLAVPTLLVVDYAETRTDQVSALVAAALAHRGPTPLRILLVARSGGDWWDQVAANAPRGLRDVVTATPIDRLAPLAVDDREALFTHAVRGLAGQIDGDPHGEVEVPDLTIPPFGSPLKVAMAALTALLAAPPSPSKPGRVMSSAADFILDHERPYWSAAARVRGVELEPDDQRVAVAVAALCGAEDESTALALLCRLPGLADDTDDGHRRRRRATRWLRELYPPPTTEHGGKVDRSAYWGSLQPDLLAEHLVALVVADDPGLLPRVLAEPSASQARQALRVLARTASGRPEIGRRLTELIRSRFDLAVHSVAVVPETENPTVLLSALAAMVDDLPRHPDSVPMLWELAEAFPRRSQLLYDLEFQVRMVIAEIHTANDDGLSTWSDRVSFAAAMAGLAGRLAATGLTYQALQGYGLAVRLYDELAEHSEVFLPDLARVLAGLARQEAAAGARHSAVVAMDRALEISELLAGEDGSAHGPLLASTLHTFADLFPTSRTDDALAAMERCVALHEQRDTTDPEVRADLASAFTGLCRILVAADQLDEAVAAARRAADLNEELAKANSDAHLPGLADALYMLSAVLSGRSEFAQALTPAERTVPIWAELAKGSLARYGRSLLYAMQMLGFLRLETGDQDGAGVEFVRVIDLSRSSAIGLDAHENPALNAARLLRAAYRAGSMKTTTAEWERVRTSPVPRWLTDEDDHLVDHEVDWYQQAAQAGDPNAVRHLAWLYEQQDDLAAAEPWYRQAAEAGNVTDMFQLGNTLRRRGHQDAAAPWWQRAAEAGNTNAVTNLALHLMTRGELASAETWSRQAAVLGHVPAMTALGGVLIARGEPAEAQVWLRKASYAGDPLAVNNLLGLLAARRDHGEAALRNVRSVEWQNSADPRP